MRFLFSILSISLLLISCSNQSELSKNFECKNLSLENSEPIKDFNNNFILKIPRSWKTELYYDKIQSEIFTADTTKQLTETFILDASYNLGTIEFDKQFKFKMDSLQNSQNLRIISSKKGTFQSKPSFWYVSKGIKNGHPYHQFNLTVVLSENTYFNSYADIYGDEFIDERICKAIAIIDEIEFLQ